MCAQTEEIPYKYVSVTGDGRGRRDRSPTTTAAHSPIATSGPSSVTCISTRRQTNATSRCVYVLHPTRWMTVDYGKRFG